MDHIEASLNSFMQVGKLLRGEKIILKGEKSMGHMVGAPEVQKFLEMYESLQTAVHRAGGAGYSVHELGNMTVVDLIQRLATNNVRFIYTGPKRAEEEVDGD
jgi:hypothetical protein